MGVITSYSIHYTKLYEQLHRLLHQPELLPLLRLRLCLYCFHLLLPPDQPFQSHQRFHYTRLFRITSYNVCYTKLLRTSYALLPLEEEPSCEITIAGEEATLTNGKIQVYVKYHSWHKRCQIFFYNDRKELLFKEIDPQGALEKHAHAYKPIIGGDHRITAQFFCDEKESLYGMGQYQQETMNIKNCTFELAHRNSQASVPFVLSDNVITSYSIHYTKLYEYGHCISRKETQ